MDAKHGLDEEYIYSRYTWHKQNNTKFPMRATLEDARKIVSDTAYHTINNIVQRYTKEAKARLDALMYQAPSRRAIVWDIETLPIKKELLSWTLRGNEWDHYETIKIEKHIFCISWGLVGDDEVYTASMTAADLKKRARGQGIGYFYDDRVIKAFHGFLQPGDVLIGWNSDRFDMKHFMERVSTMGLSPLPPLDTVDLMKEKKKIAAASSNAMDYSAQVARIGGKLNGYKRDMDAVKAICAGDPEAMARDIEYCEQDIRAQRELYWHYLPYIKRHPNMADPGTWNCPKCNAPTERQGYDFISTQGVRRAAHKCDNCGSIVPDRSSKNSKPYLKV